MDKVPKVGVIMGSTSDWPIMKKACETLEAYGVPYSKDVVSAHRTPFKMMAYAHDAREAGMSVIIAGAGGAAHLPGMVAAYTTLPVIGVPINATALDGMDSLLSIAQMPKGVPVATVAIDNATNAAILAVQILATVDKDLEDKLQMIRDTSRDIVLNTELPETTNEDIHDTNKTSRRNKRRSGRSNTELFRKRFKNHSHNRRASLLHKRRG